MSRAPVQEFRAGGGCVPIVQIDARSRRRVHVVDAAGRTIGTADTAELLSGLLKRHGIESDILFREGHCLRCGRIRVKKPNLVCWGCFSQLRAARCPCGAPRSRKRRRCVACQSRVYDERRAAREAERRRRLSCVDCGALKKHPNKTGRCATCQRAWVAAQPKGPSPAERYHADPAYRAKTIENAKARYRRLKEQATR